MSVNGIGSSTNYTAQLYASLAQLNAENGTSGSNPTGTAAAAQGGQLSTALSQALAELGINANSSSNSSNSAGTASQDQVNALVQSLAAALQTQNGTINPVAGNGASGTGQSSLESNLQNLIYQVNSNVAGTLGSLFDAATGNGGTDASNPFATANSGNASTSPLDALQNSFNSLFSTQNSDSNSPSLASFLQSTLNNVQGATSSGNLISTKA